VGRAGRGQSAASRKALSKVCEECWRPVYTWIRRQGYRREDAEDLTQAYFARFVEKSVAAQYRRRGEGCFRPFLLVSVRNFVANERDRKRALKRGGGVAPLSLDAVAYGPGAMRGLADATTPERILERARAVRLVRDGLQRLRAEHSNGRGRRFDRLYAHLVGDPEAEPYQDIAAEWGVGESAVRVAVHRLRRRLAEILRDVRGPV
jgi:RNA polymerase sigma-70 factor (ECF subfamily)